MIIKGKSRNNGAQLGAYLLKTDENEIATILHCDYSPTDDLAEALSDMEILAAATKGENGLYHAQINPEARYDMSAEQWMRSADVLEEELGLKDQPRVIVLHQKEGRPHLHVVWARTDLKKMTLVSDGLNYQKHECAARTLEQEFGHDLTLGRLHPDPSLRENFNSRFNHAEWQQSKRTKLDYRDLGQALQTLYQTSDSGRAFQAALADQGYILAQGNRRAFVVVDPTGTVHSLSRRLEGVKSREIKEKLRDVDRIDLPTAEQAQSRQRQTPHPPDQKIELPTPVQAFNDAAKKTNTPQTPQPPQPLTPEQQREELEERRRKFLEAQRREHIHQEAFWAESRREALAGFDTWLQHQAIEEDKARLRPPDDLTENMKHYWELIQDRINPARVLRRAEKRNRQRAEKQGLRRTIRSRELASWAQEQRVDFRKAQARKLEEFDRRRAEEFSLIDREAARYDQLRQQREARESSTRERDKGGRDKDPPLRGSPRPVSRIRRLFQRLARRFSLSTAFNAVAHHPRRPHRPPPPRNSSPALPLKSRVLRPEPRPRARSRPTRASDRRSPFSP